METQTKLEMYKNALFLLRVVIICIIFSSCKNQTKCGSIKLGALEFLESIPVEQKELYQAYLSSFKCEMLHSIEFLNKSEYAKREFYGVVIKVENKNDSFKEDFRLCDEIEVERFLNNFEITEDMVSYRDLKNLECRIVNESTVYFGNYTKGKELFIFLISFDRMNL